MGWLGALGLAGDRGCRQAAALPSSRLIAERVVEHLRGDLDHRTYPESPFSYRDLHRNHKERQTSTSNRATVL